MRGIGATTAARYHGQHAESLFLHVAAHADDLGCAVDLESDAERPARVPKLLSPEFRIGLLTRQGAAFLGAYAWAFYAHLGSGPTSLMLGTILVSDRLRRASPIWHRWLGRVQVACVLLVVAPSGLWMARLRGDRIRRSCWTWLAGACHCRVCSSWVEGCRKAEICGPSTLDVAHVRPLVLSSRDPPDRRLGDRRAYRCAVAVPAVDLDKLARCRWSSWRPVGSSALDNDGWQMTNDEIPKHERMTNDEVRLTGESTCVGHRHSVCSSFFRAWAFRHSSLASASSSFPAIEISARSVATFVLALNAKVLPSTHNA